MTTTKTCPRCAEEIQATARVCRFCHAHFEISLQGYCWNCHALREADEQSRCVVCQYELTDCQVVSRLVEEHALPPSAPPSALPPAPRAAQVQTPVRRPGTCGWQSLRTCLVVIILLISVFILLIQGGFTGKLDQLLASVQGVTLTPTVTRTTRPTATLTPTRTPLPTPTPWPTRTPTPAPLEVTFDSIEGLERNRLVILVGRLDLMSATKCTTQGSTTTCGLLLENPQNPDQKITIFVAVGENPNQMKPLPDTYTKNDIQVRLDDGTYAVIGYRLRVHGRVCITTVDTACITDITKIELVQLK